MSGPRPAKTRLQAGSMFPPSCTGLVRACRVASDDTCESSAPGCPAQGRARQASSPVQCSRRHARAWSVNAGLRQTTLAKARLLDARLKAGLDAPPGRFDVPAVMHGLGPCMQGRVRRHLRKLGSWMPGSRPGKTRLRACSMLPPSCTGLTWLDPCVQGCVRRHLRNLGSWMAGSRPRLSGTIYACHAARSKTRRARWARRVCAWRVA